MSEEQEITKKVVKKAKLPEPEPEHSHRTCTICDSIHDRGVIDDVEFHDFKKAVMDAEARSTKGLPYIR